MEDTWSYNSGSETIRQIRDFDKYYPKWEKEIIDWVDYLPKFYQINVGNRDFTLVHAALQSELRWPQDHTLNGKDFAIKIPGTPCLQEIQSIIWDRTVWLVDKYEWPFDIICGHTPIMTIDVDMLKEYIPCEQKVENGILHFGTGLRKHIIDCGVNRGGKLACLRLDDMKEFYIESE